MQQPLPADQRPDGWDAATAHYEDTVERITARFAQKMFDHADVGVGTKLLDVASGAGVVALSAAKLGADVLATDFSPKMADRLRERVAAEGLPNVRVEVMDGQALDLPDASQDIVTCNFGVIFFPDHAAGFGEFSRVLRSGGTALITTWGSPDRVALFPLIMAAVQEAVPDFQFTPPGSNALNFSDSAVMSDALRQAGFATVDAHTSSEPWVLPSARTIEGQMQTNPGLANLKAQITPEQFEATIQATVRILQERHGDGPVTLDMEAHLFVAHKP
ncbi:MAG: class I SAM-dependent methyltransferase [Chloroflexi bacterium]|nr:class I SAM-dependent methyltransferase [Chloroflexota bacterium]MDA1175424.1 class I SAM-dependent methyltransferase [Chloroflexota bacterium]